MQSGGLLWVNLNYPCPSLLTSSFRNRFLKISTLSSTSSSGVWHWKVEGNENIYLCFGCGLGMGELNTFVSSSLNVSDGPSASIEAEFESSGLGSFSGSNYRTDMDKYWNHYVECYQWGNWFSKWLTCFRTFFIKYVRKPAARNVSSRFSPYAGSTSNSPFRHCNVFSEIWTRLKRKLKKDFFFCFSIWIIVFLRMSERVWVCEKY